MTAQNANRLPFGSSTGGCEACGGLGWQWHQRVFYHEPPVRMRIPCAGCRTAEFEKVSRRAGICLFYDNKKTGMREARDVGTGEVMYAVRDFVVSLVTENAVHRAVAQGRLASKMLRLDETQTAVLLLAGHWGYYPDWTGDDS